MSLPRPGPHRPLGVTSSLLTSLGLALQAIAQGLLKEAIASTSCPTQTILWFPVTGGLKLKLLSVVYRAGPAATLSYASNLAHTILFCTSPVPTGLLIFLNTTRLFLTLLSLISPCLHPPHLSGLSSTVTSSERSSPPLPYVTSTPMSLFEMLFLFLCLLVYSQYPGRGCWGHRAGTTFCLLSSHTSSFLCSSPIGQHYWPRLEAR